VPGTPRARTPSPEPDEPVAEALGVNVHAQQLVDGRDRKQLERLARYITRPPLAQDRLELRADGRLELTLKKVWKDGTRAVLLEPDDLLVRLCAAVPAPRRHLLRYFGVLSSHNASRSFQNVHDLKQLLLDDELQIARNLTRQLTVYATGAPIGFSDRADIEQILARTRSRGYGVRSIVHEIVQSRLFQNK